MAGGMANVAENSAISRGLMAIAYGAAPPFHLIQTIRDLYLCRWNGMSPLPLMKAIVGDMGLYQLPPWTASNHLLLLGIHGGVTDSGVNTSL